MRKLVVAAAMVAASASAGCASHSASPARTMSSSKPVVGLAQDTGPTFDVTVAHGCPKRLDDPSRPSNSAAGLTDRLLPDDATPSAGLICEFGAAESGQALTTELRRSVRLDTAKADTLAHVAGRLSLAPLTGAVSCPADFYGAVTIIAFTYPNDRTIDLQFHTAGCRTLSNGYVVANEVEHSAFYDGFEGVFASLAPQPPSQGGG
jgi:hypothetical protein